MKKLTLFLILLLLVVSVVLPVSAETLHVVVPQYGTAAYYIKNMYPDQGALDETENVIERLTYMKVVLIPKDIEPSTHSGTFTCNATGNSFEGTYTYSATTHTLNITPTLKMWTDTGTSCLFTFSGINSTSTFYSGEDWSWGTYHHCISGYGTKQRCLAGTYDWVLGTDNVTVSWQAVNTLNSETLAGVTWSVYDADTTTWYNDTLSESEYEFVTDVAIDDCLYGTASKSGFTSDRVPTTLCDMVSEDTTKYAYLSPVGGGGYVTITFYVYWKPTPSTTAPVYWALVTVGAVTHATAANGYTTFNVSNATNYTYSVSKTGFTTAGGTIVVADADILKEVQLFPSGTTPPTPTPVPTTTLSPTGPGGILISRLSGILGSFFLAALIIFAFMVGAAYGMGQFAPALAGYGIIAGGLLGFICTVFLGLISMAWLFAAFGLMGMVFAIKWFGGGGGG